MKPLQFTVSTPIRLKAAASLRRARRAPQIAVEPRFVVASHGGQVLAASSCALRVTTALGGELYYFPRADVREEWLESGQDLKRARFFSLRAGGRLVRRAAWMLLEPRPDARALAGRVAFDADKIDRIAAEPARAH